MSADFTSPIIQALAQHRSGARVLDDFAGGQIHRLRSRGAHPAVKIVETIEMLEGQLGPVGPQVVRFRIQRE